MSPDATLREALKAPLNPRPSLFWPFVSLMMTVAFSLMMQVFAVHIQVDGIENRQWDNAYHVVAEYGRLCKRLYISNEEARAANRTLVEQIHDMKVHKRNPFGNDPILLHDEHTD